MFQGVLALLIQIALTAAAPIEAQTKDDILGYRIGGGVGAFIVLVLDIIVWCKHIPSILLHRRWSPRLAVTCAVEPEATKANSLQ